MLSLAEHTAATPMILCENLVKIYKTKDIEVVALQGLDLTIEQGEYTAIIGNSGSGKSTLLNMLGCLDQPSAGKLMIGGENVLKYNKKQIMEFKRSKVGFVWQNNARNLIPYLSALENILLPMRLNGTPDREYALQLLDMVGLSNRKQNRLSELSGGEQQRVAIAIALANRPKLLLADEPTGAVDTKTTAQILDIFKHFNRELGITVVLVTHDRQVSRYVNRVVAIRDGRTSSEFIKHSYLKELEELDSFSADGIAEEHNDQSHAEFAVLDRVGRLQLPADYLKNLELSGNKVLVTYQDGKIILTNPEQKE